jgi:2-polyprenyl-6-methoxyphenol hydroxylase-like FAD-dependent oxidoreductase
VAALEDAEVLGDLVTAHDSLDDALAAFTGRRYDRVRTVVEASLQMAQWNLDHVQGDVPGLTRRIAELVAVPA